MSAAGRSAPTDASSPTAPTASAPNDREWTQQWGLSQTDERPGIGVVEAWPVTTGSPAVIVAVLDTGVNNHPDLKRVLPGWDFVGNDADTSEDDGGCFTGPPSYQGTRIAGIVGAEANNRIGVAGVAPKVSVLPVRVANQCGSANSGDLSSAIRWAAGLSVPEAPRNPYPAKVIHVASRFPGACSVQPAVDDAVAAGAIVVADAGTNIYAGPNLPPITDVWSPGNCADVITVAGSDETGELLSWSNFGPEVDLAVPGASIMSTDRNTALSKPWVSKRFGTGYAARSGPQYGSALLAGIAALAATVDPTITSAELSAVLTASARPFVDACPGCGAGLADAGDALAALTWTPSTTVPPPGGPLFLGATQPIGFAGVVAERATITLSQGSTTATLGTVRRLDRLAVPTSGFTAGPATLTVTPMIAKAVAPDEPAFSVTVELLAPVVEIVRPLAALITGVKRTIAWQTTGATTATGSLLMVRPDGQQVVLNPKVNLAKGTFVFTPTDGASGTHTFVIQPDPGSGIAPASRSVQVGAMNATAFLTLASPTVGGRGSIMVSTDFIGAGEPVTVWAVVDGRRIRLGKSRLEVGLGSATFVIPRRLRDTTFTFEVSTLLTGSTLSCLTPLTVNNVTNWVPCPDRPYEIGSPGS